MWTSLAAFAFGCMGCGGGDGGGAGGSGVVPPAHTPAPTPPSTTQPPPSPAPQQAMLRVVHASPDAPSVDVWAAGGSQPLVTGLRYGQTSAYLALAAGSYSLELRASPSTPSSPAVVTTGALSIDAGARMTAIAGGLAKSTDAAEALRVLPYVEGFGAPGSGQAIVRVVHACADAPAVGIDVGNDDPSMPEIASLARFADTGASGVALPSGQSLQLGIDAGGAAVTAFTAPALPDGADLFVIATGLLEALPREGSGGGLVWSIALRRSPSPADAEDAVQEIFVDLWRSAARFDPAASSETAFVAMIARRRLIDRLRRNKSRPETEPLSERLGIESSAVGAETCVEAGRAAQALSQLRPEQRTVLVLAVCHGLSHEEIAQRTGMPLGTVKAHARRGLLRVREALLGTRLAAEKAS